MMTFVAIVVLSAFADSVLVNPGDDKRKAFPLPTGRGSCSMSLYTEYPWRIASSWIEARDSETLWKRHSKTFYTLSNAYAPQEYVVIGGTLVKGYDGRGIPPRFQLTVPSIDLHWEEACGDASDEDKEDDTPAALLVTSDKNRHRHLIVSPATDKTFAIGRRVTLLWSHGNMIRVWRRYGVSQESELSNGTTMMLDGPTSLRIEPLQVSNEKIRFTAYGEGDDYSGSSVEDTVWAFTYDLDLSCVKFNHNSASTATDGINLRRNLDDGFDLSRGEWNIENGAVAPICYRTNQNVTVKARFKTTSQLLHSAQIRATTANEGAGGGCLRPFGAQTVAFNGGETQDISFTMTGTTPSSISLFEQERLNWLASRINGDSRVAEHVITNSGPHRVFVILGDPVSPWRNDVNNVQNVWTNALEFIMPVVGGAATRSDMLSRVTTHNFNNMSFVYDTYEGRPRYYSVTNNTFLLTEYMRKTHLVVNCYDQAFSTMVFGCLLGSDVKFCYTQPFGYLNVVNLIKVGPCNNPFYTNPSYPSAKICGEDDITRSSFGNHMHALLDDLVYDACAGPITGTCSISGYWVAFIDISTPFECNCSIFSDIIPAQGKTLSVGNSDCALE